MKTIEHKDAGLIPEDTIFDEVVEFLYEKEFASIFDLQKKFRIGYSRAEKILDRLSAAGIIEYFENGQSLRFIGKEGWPKRVNKESWDRLWSGYYGKYNDLARGFLKECWSDSKKENLILSPLSVLMVLSMLAGATGGTTRDEVLSVIGDGRSYDAIKEIAKSLSDLAKDSRDLHSANAVSVKETISNTIRTEFVEDLKKTYSGELFSSSDMVNDVNRWITEKTNGMIENVVGDDAKEMLACIINAIAFESKWSEAYEEEQIWDEDFTDIDRKKKRVPMLHSTEEKYIENKLLTGFIKNYKRCEYSFMGLLPKKSGASQIGKCIKEIDFTETFSSALDCDVEVTIPEFSYKSKLDLSDYCKIMGIEKAFSRNADFSPLSSEWLKVEKILHSARIELDRCGTKAAAATVMEVFAGCALSLWERKMVKLDRPFVYAIMHNETKIPVFIGVVNHI